MSVASAIEAIVVMLELRKIGFFSFRGQRNCDWALGPEFKNSADTWAKWESIPREESEEKGEDSEDSSEVDREMHKRESKAVNDIGTDQVAYWKSKSVRLNVERNLQQLINHSQLISDVPAKGLPISLEGPLFAKSERWWNELIFAHHHGLKTLLLDWSSNPLVALYFAVENAISNREGRPMRGAVFAIRVRGSSRDTGGHGKRWKNYNDVIRRYPFGEFCPRWIMINPPLNNDRILRQSGKFSYHPSIIDRKLVNERGEVADQQGLYPDEALIKIEIGRKGAPDISDDVRKLLGYMSIHRASLFPDHDGVATYINDEWKAIATDAPRILPSLVGEVNLHGLIDIRSILGDLF